MAAAGSGSRLGAPVPKALVEPDGISLMCRSVLAMHDGGVGRVVATTSKGCLSIFEAALSGLDDITCTVGGTERQGSIRFGLDVLSGRLGPEITVLIHDAARLLVSPQIVTAVLCAVVHDTEAAIPVVAVYDPIRQVGDDEFRIVDRSTLRATQTPQGARLGLLHETHEYAARHGLVITDGASAIEVLGHRVVLVSGHHDALKVTEQPDLALAQGIPGGRSRI